jgi:hypothetical protein
MLADMNMNAMFVLFSLTLLYDVHNMIKVLWTTANAKTGTSYTLIILVFDNLDFIFYIS